MTAAFRTRCGFALRTESVALVLALAAGLAITGLCTAFGPERLLTVLAAGASVASLLIWPEVALAAYSFAGDVKGNDALSALIPVDLTLALGLVLVGGIIANFMRGRRVLAFPRSYLLFVVLAVQMTVSLAYAPVFDAGLDKLLRFLTVTAVVIVAPFFVLTTIEALRRFLFAFGAFGLAICGLSLLHLGGSERLVTPSENTIGLGHIACWTVILVWLAWFAPQHRNTRLQRGFAFVLLAVPALALVGSGSRGPLIACLLVIVLSTLYSPRRLLSLAIATTIGLAVVPFAGIPGAAKEYLATLTDSPNIGALLNFRGDLLNYGWIILKAHPFLGIGLQGFRYGAPNPVVYNWPHNIFLEVACELGLPALFVILAIFLATARESWRQLLGLGSGYVTLAEICAALFLTGAINATNTGDINSDRSSWLFISLVFVLSQIAEKRPAHAEIHQVLTAPQPRLLEAHT